MQIRSHACTRLTCASSKTTLHHFSLVKGVGTTSYLRLAQG